MGTISPQQVIYLSQTDGIHDQRWIQALKSLGYAVTTEISPATPPRVPLIVGPLTAMDRGLLNGTNPVIGLSWGFDLHQLVESSDTSWLANLDGIIVDSEPTRIIARESGIPELGVAVIPWGIDLDTFSSTSSRDMHSPIRLVTLRAHEDLYQVDIILRAVALLQESGHACQLLVGNTGSLSDKLKALADELQLKHCHFIGRVDESSLPELLSESDVYLSAAVTDGTSVTLLQAMAMSVPVVVSNSPGNVALLDSPSGPLGRTFETGNADSLVQEILSCLSHPEQTRDQIERARIHVQESANWSQNVLRLRTLIETVQHESS